MAATTASKRPVEDASENQVRRRILDAAFSAFMEKGYADTSTLEIAKRARVSKRELYALVGNKQDMLIACIASRAERLRVPADLPEPRDRTTLARILETWAHDCCARSAIPPSLPYSGWRSPRRCARPRSRGLWTEQEARRAAPL